MKLMGCAEKVVLVQAGRVNTSVCIAYLTADEDIEWMTHAIAHTPTEPEFVEIGSEHRLLTTSNTTPSTLWR